MKMKKYFVMALACAVLFTSCKCRQNKGGESEGVLRLNVPVRTEAVSVEKVMSLGKALVEASLKDEGALEYDMYKSETREGWLLIYETWKNQACLDKHSAADHFTTLVPQIQAAATEMSIEQFKKEAEPDTDGKTIRINCHIKTADDAHAEAAIVLAKQLVEASLNDEGVIEYDILRSVTCPTRLMIYETWKDQASLDRHSAADHFTKLVPMIQEQASEMAIEIFCK